MASLPPRRDSAQHTPLDLDELPPELEGTQHEMSTGAAPPAKPAHTRPTRLSAAFAVVATAAIVALLASVIATLRPQGSAANTSAATGTPAATISPTLPLLQQQAMITRQPGTPVIAASDPNVIYEYGDNTGLPVLQRSDDSGGTWSTLPFPDSSGTIGALTLAVNPTDATNVFLSLALNYSPVAPDACRQANPGERGVTCTQEYVSTDSGADWSLMQYPVPGSIFPNGVMFYYDASHVQTQGGRLYATLQDHNTDVQPATEIRILSSTNRGAIWRLADAALAQQGLHICDFEAAPQGTTLFARTAQLCIGDGESSRQLWRSDDAGAHWRQVTAFAAPFDALDNTLIVASANSAAPDAVILYEQVPSMKLGYYASLDGGASWQPVPSAGLPADAQVPEQVPESAVQTLRDGSLVVARSSATSPTSGGSPTSTAAATTAAATPTFTPTPDYGQQSQKTVTCYLWRAGLARWTPLTQPVADDGLAPFNLYIADGARRRIVVLTLADPTTLDPAYTIVRFE